MPRSKVCSGCGKEFEQTFGGRPRKKCYDCVPARLQQAAGKRAGGQSHETPVKPGTVEYTSPKVKAGSASQEGSATATPVSTVGKHTGKLADPVVALPGAHCPHCGAYSVRNDSYPWCNPRHRAATAQLVAEKQGAQPIRRMQSPRTRPLDRLRKQAEDRAAEERSKAASRARQRDIAA